MGQILGQQTSNMNAYLIFPQFFSSTQQTRSLRKWFIIRKLLEQFISHLQNVQIVVCRFKSVGGAAHSPFDSVNMSSDKLLGVI